MDTKTKVPQQRGILRLDTQQEQGLPSQPLTKKNILWDEEAIASHERGARQKITEPKTPFISYNQETDEILGCSGVFDVSLRWSFKKTHARWKAAIPPLELMVALDDMALDGSTLVIKADSAPISEHTSMNGTRQNPAIPDWSDDEENDNRATEPQESADHEAFMQKRLMHYNMRAALEARYDDEDDEEEQDQDVVGERRR